MKVLIYDNTTQKISKDVDGVVTEISVDEAREIWLKGQHDDHTLSFYRLACADFDKDEVERQYREMEANRS